MLKKNANKNNIQNIPVKFYITFVKTGTNTDNKGLVMVFGHSAILDYYMRRFNCWLVYYYIQGKIGNTTLSFTHSIIKIKTMTEDKKINLLQQDNPDFYFEHLYKSNPNDNMAADKKALKPEEISKLKKSHDYWQNVRLKAFSDRLKEAKKKYDTDSFEYLL